jgi:hypothetical protein
MTVMRSPTGRTAAQLRTPASSCARRRARGRPQTALPAHSPPHEALGPLKTEGRAALEDIEGGGAGARIWRQAAARSS